MLQTHFNHFNIYLFVLQQYMNFFNKYSLPLFCVLGGAGVGIYLYGSSKLSRLRAKQREEMRMHPDEPTPELPENAKQSALAFEIVGFIVLLAACLGMLMLGHFDKYLALLGIG